MWVLAFVQAAEELHSAGQAVSVGAILERASLDSYPGIEGMVWALDEVDHRGIILNP